MIKKVFAYVFFIYISVNLSYGIEKINFITERFPPFNYKENGKITGYSTDLLIETLKIMGIDKSSINITLYPWSRAYVIVKRGDQLNMLYSTTRTEAREKLFKWGGEIYPKKNSIFCMKDLNIKINNVNDIKKYTYSVNRFSSGHQWLQNNGLSNDIDKLRTTVSIEQMVDWAKKKFVDCFAYNQFAIQRYARAKKINITQFEIVYSGKKEYISL